MKYRNRKISKLERVIMISLVISLLAILPIFISVRLAVEHEKKYSNKIECAHCDGSGYIEKENKE